MNERWRLLRKPIAAGAFTTVVAVLVAALVPVSTAHVIRETAMDAVLAMAVKVRTMPAAQTPIVVIDIDSRSLDAMGPWPWPRQHIATLVEAAGRAGASTLAIDILFEGPDAKSPAALSRRLGREIQRPDLVELADGLPDGDKRLAESFRKIPVVLHFALDPDKGAQVPTIPIVRRGKPSLVGIWRVKGAIGPLEQLLPTALGLGTAALAADADGLYRRVPLFVEVGQSIHPGLALEAVRLAQGASSYVLSEAPRSVTVGDLQFALPPDAFLRLVPESVSSRSVTVVSAADVIGNKPAAEIAKDSIVLIGGSAPELGGLRATPGDALTPSVTMQAGAVLQLLRGIVPLPIPYNEIVEPGLVAAAALAGILAAVLLRPLAGAFVMLIIVGAIWLAAVGAAGMDRLFNPLTSSLVAVLVFAATAIVAFAETRRREARIRQRFEQHLAPQVVSLITSNPSVLKLRGERREITSLFTDVEGFTAMTHRSAPEILVSVLDDYFEGIAGIIIAHGGMIDKLVGDAVHALYNTPLDLPDHPMQAVRCAIEIQAWTQSYCRRDLPASLGFGRTRIGIETGMAIVGDVGLRSKLDYTAHGDTVNSAARFEAANKELGSTICVGPGTAARCDRTLLRPTGVLVLRGFTERVPTCEPWPRDAEPSWRVRYLEAVELAAKDPQAGAQRLTALAAERPHDPVPLNFARRLTMQAGLPSGPGA